jgi:ABC-type branched-subunit amino acid transport system permease subunit
MGLVFMAVVIWAPGGVVGLWQRFRATKDQA